MKRILVMSNFPNFLQWLKYIPYESNIFKPRIEGSLLQKGFYLSTLSFRLKSMCKRSDYILCDFMDDLAILASRVSPKPIYIRLHRFEVDENETFKKINWNNVKCVICVSEVYKKYVQEKISNLGVSIPVHVIYNGVDTEFFSYNERVNNPLSICTLSNLICRKRIFDLIVNNPDLDIDVGGEGIERRVLEDVIERFNLKAKLLGRVKLPDFYHFYDIFINNSEDEGFCVALLESMSCGLIPLVFDWKTAREAVPSKYIYRDYQEMRKKLDRLFNLSKDEIIKEKKSVRQIVEKRFTAKNQASNFLRIFDDYGSL